jgi:hypothetical protein
MVSDDHIHATLAGVLYGGMGSDASITGDNQFGTRRNNTRQVFDVDAMTLTGTHWDMPSHVCAEGTESLYEQSGGGLSVYIEITPNTDGLFGADGGSDALYGTVHAWER